MKLNEETFLTAYLDGELDAGQRLRVDSALLLDARLSEDLRDLATVRDLVSGLARPAAPVDVSDSVVATIRRRRDAGPLGRVIGVTAASWSTRAVALVSAAAALVAMASLDTKGPNREMSTRPVVSAHGPDGSRSPLAREDGRPSNLTLVADDSRPLAPSRDELRRERERQNVSSLLESPNLRKVLIVTDVLGGDADRQIGDLIEKTPRRNAPYCRLTVSQGIIIDPDHPGEATVFAVVMDDRELGQLRVRLDESFPETVREAEPHPDVVTELAEVGQVSVFPGTGSNVADLIDPSEILNGPRGPETRKDSIIARLVPAIPGVDPLDPGSAGYLDGSAQEPERSAVGPGGRDGSSARNPTSPLQPRTRPESSVVLVWVVSNRRDGPGSR